MNNSMGELVWRKRGIVNKEIYEKFMDNSMGIHVEKKKEDLIFSRRGAESAEVYR